MNIFEIKKSPLFGLQAEIFVKIIVLRTTLDMMAECSARLLVIKRMNKKSYISIFRIDTLDTFFYLSGRKVIAIYKARQDILFQKSLNEPNSQLMEEGNIHGSRRVVSESVWTIFFSFVFFLLLNLYNWVEVTNTLIKHMLNKESNRYKVIYESYIFLWPELNIRTFLCVLGGGLVMCADDVCWAGD